MPKHAGRPGRPTRRRILAAEGPHSPSALGILVHTALKKLVSECQQEIAGVCRTGVEDDPRIISKTGHHASDGCFDQLRIEVTLPQGGSMAFK